ncbi:alpha/beta fold hydrolase [Streptomyces flavalbus]|uniref:Alpha/beta fold hydrolase n=1 Tax=Streptomyces flavalbus TaxID=2665155 RepID=A0ABW2W055_9ACTN
MTDGPARPTLLLVHGAWHGAWCWDKLASALRAEGHRVRTVGLPSAGGRTGLREDARTIRTALTHVDGPVVLVGHSYGGIPASEAAAGAGNVSHLVYLTAYQLDVGESLLGFHGVPTPPDGEAVTRSVPENPVAMFYGDVEPGEAEEAAKRLVPQSTKSFRDTLTEAGWHTVPSTYIVCENDRALPPETQERLAVRSGAVHRLASGHSPFFSHPAELAAVLTEISPGVRRSGST